MLLNINDFLPYFDLAGMLIHFIQSRIKVIFREILWEEYGSA
jgi:hypothetical protein